METLESFYKKDMRSKYWIAMKVRLTVTDKPLDLQTVYSIGECYSNSGEWNVYDIILEHLLQ